MARRQRDELFAPAVEEWIGADDERAGPLLRQGREGGVDLAFGAGVQDMKLQPERARRRLHVSRYWSRHSGLVGLTSTRDDASPWAPARAAAPAALAPARQLNEVTPGDVAARPVEAGDKASFDRVAADREDDRNRRGRRLGRERRSGAAGRDDHGHLAANQIGRQRRQPIVSALRPAIFDRHVRPST